MFKDEYNKMKDNKDKDQKRPAPETEEEPALLQGQCPVDEDLRSKTRSCRSRNLVSSKILDLLLHPGIRRRPLT